METQNLNSNKILRYIAFSLLGILLVCLLFGGGMVYQKKKSTAAEKYLQEQIEQYQAEAEKWKNQFESMSSQKTLLLSNIDSLEVEIKNLKKNYGQKITVVKSYSNPELEQFFSERYGY